VSTDYYKKGIYSVSIYSVSKSGGKSMVANPLPLVVTGASTLLGSVVDSYRIYDFVIMLLLVVIIVALARRNKKLILLLQQQKIL
jgi:hypothetical protein